jgi:hypothetical protein
MIHKMRNVYIALCLLVLSTGCGKDPFSPGSAPQADFTITRSRTLTSGQTVSKTETALNLDASSTFKAAFQVKGANLVFDIGGKKITTVEPTLSASIVFYTQTEPLKIAGTYSLPEDSDVVNVFFCDVSGQGSYYCVDEPIDGNIVIQYDPLQKKWNGNITKLKYNIPPQADYTIEECSVKFSDIQFKR